MFFASGEMLPGRKRLKWSAVTNLSLRLAQNEPKQRKSKEEKLSLSYGWQRDLGEFSIR